MSLVSSFAPDGSVIRIRPATPEDIREMTDLLEELFSIEADFSPDPLKQAKGIALLLTSASAGVFVAQKTRQIVGMVTVQAVISTAEGGRSGLMEDLIVTKSLRGKGIGSALFAMVQTWCRNRGISRIQLLADQNNPAALRFYTKSGWSRTELITLRYRSTNKEKGFS